jgi:hypothetical protein
MQDYKKYEERRRLAAQTFEGTYKLYEANFDIELDKDKKEVNFDTLYATNDPAKQWTTNAKGDKVHTYK